MDQNDVNAMYDNADKFINLANEMHKTASPEKIGLALRYAASRYSAFEASLHTTNLSADKEHYLQFFENNFAEMLKTNFEDYINRMADK